MQGNARGTYRYVCKVSRECMEMYGTGCKVPEECRGMKGNARGTYGSGHSARGMQGNARGTYGSGCKVPGKRRRMPGECMGVSNVQ